MDTKLGQSERIGKKKKEKALDVHWQLYLKLNHQKQQVEGTLKMPANLPNRYKGEGIRPPVILEVFDEHEVKLAEGKIDEDKARKEKIYEDKVHALSVMRDSAASGILHARLVLEGKSPLMHFVEPYDGNLADYLMSKQLGIPEFFSGAEIVLPTSNLSSAVSQVVDGMKQLIISGHYHGNFTLENTYYIINETGALVLKLSSFKRKRGSRLEILAADWHSVADGLVKIRDIAEKLNVMSKDLPKIVTCQLDGLINLLRDIAPCNAESASELIKQQPFFWGKAERKIFFISTIPFALKKKKFVSAVNNANFIDLPWGGDGFDGFIKKMNQYRKEHGQEEYNTNSRKEFVQFISGLYTHEEEIKALLRVDVALQKRHPKLCYQLYTLLPPSARTIGA